MTLEQWLGEDNKLGQDIWHKKYQFNNESFDEWLDRVSGGNKALRQLILERKFLFGGRTLANRGTGKKGSFSNCYSRGFVDDSVEGLMQASTDIALTFKAQGGQGISLSNIRPKGCGINGGQYDSDGIIPFMELYNQTTMSISQGGSRKGALIMSIDIWHKEAEDFIKIKSDAGKIEKANLSLEIDDEFMECVEKYYETGVIETIPITRVYNGNVVEYEVTPIKLYKLMMEKAYDWAEPGCIFTNRFRNYNMMQFHSEYKIETCNPCGEQPLPKHGACNLGSINLSEFVKNPFTSFARFEYDEFFDAVCVAIEGLDEVLDENMNNHPLKEQREMAFNYRNVGLGIMGMHDFLIKMGVTYGNRTSMELIDKVMYTMFRAAIIESSTLAHQKGRFPKYDDCVLDSEIIKKHFTDEELEQFGIKERGLRNCSLLSIAPSGSIGTMLNISTGCEPLFQISYTRKTESLNGEDTYYKVYSGIAQEYINHFNTTELPDCFNTSSDINWHDRVDIQSILQDHIDTAISSTVNLPNEITQEEIEQLYLYAWKKGLKGVTIYRDGCKRSGILSVEIEKKNNKYEISGLKELPRGYVLSVSDDLISYKRTIKTGCGKMYLHIDFDENTGEPLESWIDLGSGGGCERNLQFISRLISAGLRYGMPLSEVIEQAKSIRPCISYVSRTKTHGDTSPGTSCPGALGIALQELQNKINERCFVNEEENEMVVKKTTTPKKLVDHKENKLLCPECGEPLSAVGGCFSCTSCSYSKCE